MGDETGFVDSNGVDAAKSFTLFIADIQPNVEDLAKAGEWLVNKRRSESLAGMDVEGNSFAPYSPQYASRKGSSAVTLRSLKSGPHMLDALTYRIGDGDESDTSSLEVGIFGNEELATKARVQNEGATIRTVLGGGPLKRRLGGRFSGKKATLTIPARNWLGASDSDLATMQNIIAESVADRVKSSQ